VKSILRRRPSPALVIACIALFVSMGGVSYGVATGFIDSRELKNNTVRSKDVRNNTLRTFDIRNNEIRGFDVRNSSIQGRDVAFNTLTGDDIAEEELGKVPSAAAADAATSATTAGAVEGVTMRKISYSAEQNTGFVEVLNLGGLRLEAGCGGGGDLDVRVAPALTNAEIDTTHTGGGSLIDGPGPGVTVFAGADGSVVTIQGLAVEDVDDVRGTTDDCGFFAVAEAG
jgi:hypothetical protein